MNLSGNISLESGKLVVASPEGIFPEPPLRRWQDCVGKERKRLRNKAWIENNQEKMAAMRKSWLEKNRDRKSATNKAWLKNNPDKMIAARKKWLDKNHARKSATNKAWIENNPDRMAALVKTWREKNRDRHAATTKAWNEKNRDRRSATNKAWYEKNRDRSRVMAKAWRENNFAKMKSARKAWKVSNPIKVRTYKGRRRAREFGVESDSILAFACALNKSTKAKTCFYCGTKTDKFHLDHIQPLAKGGTHCLHNLVVSCPSCNCRKGTMPVNEFIKKGQLVLL